MRRPLGDAALLALSSALYGFSIGSVHSLRFGLHDLLKVPLLIAVTGAICGVAYHLVAGIVGLGLRFGEVQRLALRLFRDIALMLAALAPVNVFLAHTIVKPDLVGLGEYPLFLGLNVAFIALAGSLALALRVRRLTAPLARRLATVGGWLAISLVVGGQVAWTLRPFFGVASIPGDQTRFFLGSAADYSGSTNFYEAVYHLVAPVPLDADYTLRGRGYD